MESPCAIVLVRWQWRDQRGDRPLQAPHRREAFDACSAALDTKETVPVCKKVLRGRQVWVGQVGVRLRLTIMNFDVTDKLNRPLRDLRSPSQTGDFRCTYCMPKEVLGAISIFSHTPTC